MPIKYKGTRKHPVKFHGSPLVVASYQGKFTADDAIEKVVAIQQAAIRKNEPGEISVNLLFPGKDKNQPGRWINITPFTDIKSDLKFLKLGDLEEDYFGHLNLVIPGHFFGMQIFISKRNNGGRMGNNEYNDCLYDVLNELIPDVMRISYPSATEFKHRLNLLRKEKVPIEKIPEIEKRLGKQYKIDVYGDTTYKSPRDSAKYTLKLYLSNEHVYKIRNSKKELASKGVTKHDRMPVLYRYCPKAPHKIKIYNGERLGYCGYDEIQKHSYYKMEFQSSLMFIKSPEEDLVECYNEFVRNADFLKEKTDGVYNLYKTGSPLKCVLTRFFEINKFVDVEDILPDEAEWILKANSGAMIWGKSDYEGFGAEYDFNSYYSSLMTSQKFSIPIKRGEFKTYTNSEFKKLTYYPYGIYHCIIKNKNFHLLRTNRENYYTHFDLQRAKELGYKINIIEDGKENVLEYSGAKMRINGNVAFKTIIDELYPLKKKYGAEYPIFKQLLNFIWGGLCEKNKRKIFGTDSKEMEITGPAEKLKRIVYIGDTDYFVVHTESLDNRFNCRYARLGPFLLAKGRMTMSRTIEPHIEYIKRVHTDGFISSKPLEFECSKDKRSVQISVGTGLGELKYEGYCKKLKVMNNIKVIDLKTGESYKKSLKK